jgi:hypothetical protein
MEEKVIVMVDISGSGLQRAEDQERREAWAMGQITDVAQCHGGDIVEAAVDGLHCSFATAEQAADAAIEMQVVLNAQSNDLDPSASAPVPLRIGIAFGSAQCDANTVAGDAMTVVNRLVDLAKSGQILATGSMIGRLPPMLQGTARKIDTVPVDVEGTPLDVREIVWHHGDVIQMMDNVLNTDAFKRRIVLRCGERSYTMFEDGPKFVIGRSRQADLQINRDSISREHVAIEFRNGEFMVRDMSVNGSYVIMDGQTHFLKQNEVMMSARGHIFPGDAPVHEGAIDVAFWIEFEPVLT